jgi:adenosine kinase
MNPITPRNVRDLLESDIFVFVPLTDYEIDLETLEFIKAYSKGLVIFDAHGQTTTMTSLGDRIAKFWVDRDLWLPYIDVLVMNLEEAKCSWFMKEYTLEQLEDRNAISKEELVLLAEHCLERGVKALYVTLGAKGCLVYFNKDGKMQREHIPATPKENIVATIGCGEAFLGGLTYGLLTGKDYVVSGKLANIAAAHRCGGLTYDVYKSLDKVFSELE